MSNFSFLHENTQYALFASAAIEAEKVYTSAPAMCAVGCRKALELMMNITNYQKKNKKNTV